MALIFWLSACTNEYLHPKDELIASTQFVKIDFPIENLIKNKLDPEDELINSRLYILMEAFEEIIKKNNVRNFTLEELKANNGELSIQKLAQKSNDFKTTLEIAIDQVIKHKNISDLSSKDFIRKNEEILKNGNVFYETGIYIPNLETADFSLAPIVAIGTDIDYDNIQGWDYMNELEGYDDDFIPARIYDEQGGYQNLIIGEEGVLNTTRPVLIMNVFNEDITIIPFTQETNKNQMTVNAYQIDHRYDVSRKSEYRITTRTSSLTTTQVGNGTGFNIAKVHKNDIGKPFYNVNYNVFYSPFIQNPVGAWFVTFEYDWWASKKFVAVNVGQESQIFECRMKNLTDWYQTGYITRNSNNTFTSKGFINIIWN